jgi:hypothetical protein
MAGLRWVFSGVCVIALVSAGCHLPAARPSDGAGAAPASDYTVGWGQIRSGMTPDEVLAVLDEPRDIKVTRVNTYWYYSERGAEGPHIVFGTRTNTVERWRAPR